MTAAFIILIALLTNQVIDARINSTKLISNVDASVTTLSAKSYKHATVFALQIRQIRSVKEAAPSTSGSNLNVVGTALNANRVHPGNFLREISTIQSFRNKDEKNKKHDVLRKDKSFSSLYLDDIRPSFQGNDVVNDALPLVSEKCLESNLENNNKTIQESDHVKLKVFNQNKIEPESPLNYGTNKKRDAVNENNSFILEAVENSKKRYKIKTEERRQQKQDFNTFQKANLTTTTMSTDRITTDFSNDPSKIINATLYFTVTDNVSKASFTATEETRFVTKDKSKIRFSKLPQRQSYLIPTLKLEEGFYPFGFMSKFFTLIYPFDFPVGLVKDIVWGQFSFPYSFLKSIKVESTFLAFIILFACISLVIPAYLICVAFLALLAKKKNYDAETGTLFSESEISDCDNNYNVALMLFTLLVCAACVGGMTVSNEQAAAAVEISRETLRCACVDIANWLASAARELIHSFVLPVDLVLQAYKDDLRNVETLLGEPVQKAISSESGLDLVLDSLNDLIIESEDISGKISSLRDVSVRAGSIAALASDRLKDLARQLDDVKKYCSGKDSSLCDTITTHSLQLLMKFDSILHEQQLLELRSLGVENLTRAVTTAKQELLGLPSIISLQTSGIRDDILKQMELRKEAIHHSSKVLSDMVRHLTAALHTSARRFESVLLRYQTYELWRWIFMLSSIVICSVVIMLILFAILCGCGTAEQYGKRTMQLSTIWMCLSSLILWTLLSVSFLIAGHAEVYVCHALWDRPQYQTLAALLDKPSPLFPNNEGVFDAMFRDMNNITIDISVKDVLRECEQDQTAYNVFQLDRVLDVNKITSYYEWKEFHRDLGRMSTAININVLKTISSDLSRILVQMHQVSDVDLSHYRLEYNGPVVGKDLPSLVDQLENVAAQVTDLTTSGRLETLASRTQRLHLTSIKPLKQLRAELVYKLTELELQMSPFRRKLNISLSHIYTAQYYIDNQGDVIARKKVSLYAARLISHVADWRTHVLRSTSTQAARCGPLFTVFTATRALLCRRYISSLHGWWVCAFLLGVIWCCSAPLCVKIWRRYERKTSSDCLINLSNIGNCQHSRTPTTMCDTSVWNNTGPPPAHSDGW